MLHRKLFSPVPVKAGGVKAGTFVKLRDVVEGTDALAGDIGTIRHEQLPRSRGISTHIDFDDGVQVALPEGTEVYVVLSQDIGADVAAAGRRIGKGLSKLADGMATFGDNLTGDDDAPKKKPKKAKPRVANR